jgi:hypothetical protein
MVDAVRRINQATGIRTGGGGNCSHVQPSNVAGSALNDLRMNVSGGQDMSNVLKMQRSNYFFRLTTKRGNGYE